MVMDSVDRHVDKVKDRYFTQFTPLKGVFYTLLAIFLSLTLLIAILEPVLPHPPCPPPPPSPLPSCEFPNPLYNDSPCINYKYARFLFITPRQCDFARRVIAGVVMGAAIGWERREGDRPAGIRTMALVSLGACLFTLCSNFAFHSSPMEWDAARVSAAVPSGVGFLGAALIFKQAKGGTQVVHGLTTAASLWTSAAVGIACGGALYFTASFAATLLIIILRFGPRNQEENEEEGEEEEEEEEEEEKRERREEEEKMPLTRGASREGYQALGVEGRGRSGSIGEQKRKKTVQFAS